MMFGLINNCLYVVSHTPIEIETLLDIIAAGEWVDVMREIFLMMKNYIRGGHIEIEIGRFQMRWETRSYLGFLKLFPQVKSGVIYKTRSWEKPSDHVPIIIDIDI